MIAETPVPTFPFGLREGQKAKPSIRAPHWQDLEVCEMRKIWLSSLLAVLCLHAALAAEEAPIRLDLATVVELALAADPQVLSARSDVELAKVGVAQELAKIAPGCNVVCEYTTGPGGNTARISATIAQTRPGLLPGLIGGRAASAVEVALWGQADAEARLAQARIAAASGAVQKYIDALQAEKRVALCQGALALAQEDARIAEVSLEAGTVTRLDVLKARSNQEQAALDLREAEANLRIAYDSLLQQIGKPLGATVELAPLTPAAFEARDEEALLEMMLAQRAEAITARTAVRKAERQLMLAENETLPSLSVTARERQGACTLTATYDLFSGDVSWQVAGEHRTSSIQAHPGGEEEEEQLEGFSLGLTLTWRPFDGGQKKAAIEAARINLASAEASLARMRGDLALELRRHLLDCEMAALRLEQAKTARELAVQTRELAALRYREGVALFSELSQATQALAQAENNVLGAEGNLLLSLVRLDQACGRMPAAIVAGSSAAAEGGCSCL